MDYIILLAATIGLVIWYIRPLYNFMAKRKYLLLDSDSLSLSRKLQIALPAIIFYILIFGLMLVPTLVNDLISINQTTSILAVQIVMIFAITRFDKWQTKYKVERNAVHFGRKQIKWDEEYTIQFKRTAFLILHKPRFIMTSKSRRIVIPMLSHQIEHFIKRLSSTNDDIGKQAKALYDNTRAYYIENIEVEKKFNNKGK